MGRLIIETLTSKNVLPIIRVAGRMLIMLTVVTVIPAATVEILFRKAVKGRKAQNNRSKK